MFLCFSFLSSKILCLLCWALIPCPVPLVAGPSTSLTTMSLLAKNTPSRSEMTKVQQQVKVNGASMTVLRREMQEIRVKQLEQQKQLQDQEQKLLEQTQVIGEQNARLAELEHKLRELMDSSAAAMGGPRPTTAVPSTSSSSVASSSVASTSATVLASGSVAVALPRMSEGESTLKRNRKSTDLPRQSKRLRSKKWETLSFNFFCFCFEVWLITLCPKSVHTNKYQVFSTLSADRHPGLCTALTGSTFV